MTTAELILQLMLTAPLPPASPGWEETVEERTARYKSIAEDAVAVSSSASDALLLIAVAEHESGFAKDVDVGPCYRGANGKNSRCDYGQAACMLQLHGSDQQRTKYFADRKTCFSTGLKALKNSQALCAPLVGQEYGFAAYAAGSCIREEGHKGSYELWRYWQRWQNSYNTAVAKEKAKKSEE